MGRISRWSYVEIEADPIAALLTALFLDGRPSLTWVVRWSAGGADPLAAAWPHAGDDFEMRTILRLVDHPALAGCGPGDEYPPAVCCDPWCRRSRCDDCVRSILRAVPTPPSLAELLAAVEHLAHV